MIHALRLDWEECAPSISWIQLRFLSEMLPKWPLFKCCCVIATYFPWTMKNNSGLLCSVLCSASFEASPTLLRGHISYRRGHYLLSKRCKETRALQLQISQFWFCGLLFVIRLFAALLRLLLTVLHNEEDFSPKSLLSWPLLDRKLALNHIQQSWVSLYLTNGPPIL